MTETVVTFEELVFAQENDRVRANYLGRYYFYLSNEELSAIAAFAVVDGTLVFQEREKRTWNKFNALLDKGLASLRGIRGKECLYIHKGSGIPLIGSNEFGVVDRGSTIIEIKPLTGCNLSCSFCSVNEGVNDKRDVLVEEEFLVEVFASLAKLKQHPVEANIGPQGEPLLYPKLVALVRDLKVHGAAVVSLNTNGTLLSEQLIDELASAGLDRINLSTHAVDQEKNDELMGGVQNLKRLREMIDYCAGKIDVLLTPVLIPGVNDDQFDGLIELSKKIKNKHWPTIGVQNFLHYPSGRNPGVKERSWDEFFAILQRKEKEHGVNLMMKGDEQNIFSIHEEKTLEKPFHKGDVLSIEIVARGRNKDEWLGTAQERVVTIRSHPNGRVGERLKVRLLRDKHNIFTAVPV